MPEKFTELLISIRLGDNNGYAVEANLSDGSTYKGKVLLAEPQLSALRQLALDPEGYGKQLFGLLFQGRIRAAFDVATGLARKQSAARLRLHLHLHNDLPAEIQSLAWESLYQPETAAPNLLAVSEQTPLARHVALERQEPAALDAPFIHLLLVVSAPSAIQQRFGLAEIDVHKELKRLLQAWRELLANGRCKLTLLPGRSGVDDEVAKLVKAVNGKIISGPATLDAISEQLRDQHILHFLGHGQYLQGQGVLYLEAADGTTALARQEELTIRLGDSQLQLLFLAACDSARRSDSVPPATASGQSSGNGLADNLVQAGIPAVIAMQRPISIDAAYNLAGEFYRRLFLEHGSVDLALNQARRLLYERKDPEWATPVLYTRLRNGQLLGVNSIFAALQAARAHPDFTKFRQERYLALPLQATVVNPGQQSLELGSHEVQPTGLTNLIEGAWQRLTHSPSHHRHHPGTLLLILGGPGTSKSTQLKHLAWKTIETSLQWQEKERFLPIYLEPEVPRFGGSFSAALLEEQILAKLAHYSDDLSFASLADLPTALRLRVCISAGDAFAETANDLLVQCAKLTDRNPSHQLILAIQPIPIPWERFEKLEKAHLHVLAIQPLGPITLRHYLQGQAGFGAKLLDTLYDAYLFELMSIPYYAIKLIRRAQQGDFPSSLTDFLQEATEESIDKLPTGEGLRANAVRTLSRLAWEMQSRGQAICSINQAFQSMSQTRENRGYAIEQLYAAFSKNDLLQPVGEEHLRFAYDSIRSWFCAKALLTMPDRNQRLRDILASFGFPPNLQRWEETLVMLCRMLVLQDTPQDKETLQLLLQPLVYGANLFKSEEIFLAARCLLECRIPAKSLPDGDLVEHVVGALRWRADSRNEPNLANRLRANRLLAQLAMPIVAIELARTTYEKVRRNMADKWDYEFSTVRYAAAIAVKRLQPSEAQRILTQLKPEVGQLFVAWQTGEVDLVIQLAQTAVDLGVQGIAALALGDLCSNLQQRNPPAAERALSQLITMFHGEETRQSVRWTVADALSQIDMKIVRKRVVHRTLDSFLNQAGTDLARPDKVCKTLAYLVGLLRLSEPRTRQFLLEHCLALVEQKPRYDWSTWSTAIVALGKIADVRDRAVLLEIAGGTYRGLALKKLFRLKQPRNYIRREAINALAAIGTLKSFEEDLRQKLDDEPELIYAFYEALQKIYWRQEPSI